MRCRTLARLPVARGPGVTSLGVSRLLRSRAVVIAALAQLACAGPAAYSNIPMLVGLPPSAGAANSTAASLDSEGGRQLQTTVMMADNTNNAKNDITSYGFDMSPTDYAAIVFAQPSLSYKCYSETTIKISVYKVSGTTNSRTITVQLQCLAGPDASFLPGTSLGSVSSTINVPNTQSFFSITVSTLADIAGYSGCELRGQASRAATQIASEVAEKRHHRRLQQTAAAVRRAWLVFPCPFLPLSRRRFAFSGCFTVSHAPTCLSSVACRPVLRLCAHQRWYDVPHALGLQLCSDRRPQRAHGHAASRIDVHGQRCRGPVCRGRPRPGVSCLFPARPGRHAVADSDAGEWTRGVPMRPQEGPAAYAAAGAGRFALSGWDILPPPAHRTPCVSLMAPRVPLQSVSSSVTSSATLTASVTPSASLTASSSVSASGSVTRTPSITASASLTMSPTPSITASSSLTPTASHVSERTAAWEGRAP